MPDNGRVKFRRGNKQVALPVQLLRIIWSVSEGYSIGDEVSLPQLRLRKLAHPSRAEIVAVFLAVRTIEPSVYRIRTHARYTLLPLHPSSDLIRRTQCFEFASYTCLECGISLYFHTYLLASFPRCVRAFLCWCCFIAAVLFVCFLSSRDIVPLSLARVLAISPAWIPLRRMFSMRSRSYCVRCLNSFRPICLFILLCYKKLHFKGELT